VDTSPTAPGANISLAAIAAKSVGNGSSLPDRLGMTATGVPSAEQPCSSKIPQRPAIRRPAWLRLVLNTMRYWKVGAQCGPRRAGMATMASLTNRMFRKGPRQRLVPILLCIYDLTNLMGLAIHSSREEDFASFRRGALTAVSGKVPHG
jgi:hypothetical protein